MAFVTDTVIKFGFYKLKKSCLDSYSIDAPLCRRANDSGSHYKELSLAIVRYLCWLSGGKTKKAKDKVKLSRPRMRRGGVDL
jgi:hypothetical protein